MEESTVCSSIHSDSHASLITEYRFLDAVVIALDAVVIAVNY